MPMRCYFNLTDGIDIISDDEGVEVSCPDEALLHACTAVEELRDEDSLSSSAWQGWWLEIVDGSGVSLKSLPLDGSRDKPSLRH
jgi:hypothetical protein